MGDGEGEGQNFAMQCTQAIELAGDLDGMADAIEAHCGATPAASTLRQAARTIVMQQFEIAELIDRRRADGR